VDTYELSMATDYYILSLHLYVSALLFCVPVRRLHHTIGEFVFHVSSTLIALPNE
jgi:hypothetical protein